MIYITKVDRKFVSETCITCSCIFFLEDVVKKQFQRTKKSFYCPHGHAQSYVTSEIENLEQKLVIEKANTQRMFDVKESIRADRDALERSMRALRGVITKLKNLGKGRQRK